MEIGAIGSHSRINKIVDDDLCVRSNGIASVDGRSLATLVSRNGGVVLRAKIEGQSAVDIRAKTSVRIEGKIDGKSSVTITADGDIYIQDKIDGASEVILNAGGNIEIGDKIDNAVVKWRGKKLTVANGINDVAKVSRF
ncbi:MAG: hypothetical protein QM831_27740 [Kofleriaceae bacterium]